MADWELRTRAMLTANDIAERARHAPALPLRNMQSLPGEQQYQPPEAERERPHGQMYGLPRGMEHQPRLALEDLEREVQLMMERRAQVQAWIIDVQRILDQATQQLQQRRDAYPGEGESAAMPQEPAVALERPPQGRQDAPVRQGRQRRRQRAVLQVQPTVAQDADRVMQTRGAAEDDELDLAGRNGRIVRPPLQQQEEDEEDDEAGVRRWRMREVSGRALAFR